MLIKDNIDITSKLFEDLYRIHIEDCVYKFYIDIENQDYNTVKNVLISDIGKLLKSIENHSKGKTLTEEEIQKFKAGIKCSHNYINNYLDKLDNVYGQTYVTVNIQYPEDVYSFNKQDLNKYTLIIPNRPIFEQKSTFSGGLIYKFNSIVLKDFTTELDSKNKINKLVNEILSNILLDEISKINFYICCYKHISGTRVFNIFILFNFINEDTIFTKREDEHNKILEDKQCQIEIKDIANKLKIIYKEGEKLKELYEKNNELFIYNENLIEEFNLFSLKKISIYLQSHGYNWVNELKQSYPDIYYNATKFNIPELITSYILSDDWYHEEYTKIYLIKYKGQYYKSEKYISYYGSGDRHWKGD